MVARGVARAMLATVLATLVAVGGLFLPQPASAAVSPASLTELKAQAIYFLRTGEDDRRQLVLDAMSAQSSWEGKLWTDFLASWQTINNGLSMNSSVPKGLPSKGHVFVVLGSALSKSGKMTTKLERRMKLTLAAARKYPHSRVLVSGGAKRNGRTEGEVMYRWLVGRGVAKSRVLVEKKSASTVGNAANSMVMLAARPAIGSYSLISDSSHLRRASILFRAATVRVQEGTGKPWAIRQLANVAYRDLATAGRTRLSASSVAYTAGNVASVLKVLPAYKDVLGDPPSAPVLTALSLTATRKRTYTVGESLDTSGLVVNAVYNKGVYTRVVTGDTTFTRFDSASVGERTAIASYTDAGVTRTAGFGYTVVKAPSRLGATFSTRSIRVSRTRVAVKASVVAPNALVPTGTVRYYLDGRRLKTVSLTAESAGTVSFTYPRIGRTGQHTFLVTYSGDSRLEPTRSVVTLTVKP